MSRLRWLGVSALMLIAAAGVSGDLLRLTGLQRSTWIRVTLAEGSAAAPPLRIMYGPGASLPVVWESEAAHSLLGIKATAPVRLLAVDTDRGMVPPWLAQTWASNWERSDSPPSLRIGGPGVVDATGTFRRFTLTFAPAPALVTVGWLDARAVLDLSASAKAGRTVTLSRPTERRGWVLLPPMRIPRLTLVREPHAAPVTIAEIALRDRGGQGWTSAVPRRGGIAEGVCATSGAGSTLRIEPSPVFCDVSLDRIGPLNEPSWALRVAAWLATAACGLSIVVAAGAAARSIVRHYPPTVVAPARLAWTRTRVIVLVLACTAAYHVSYVLAVPPHFNFDSLGYYAFGRNLWFQRTLDAVGTCRTPGYPLLTALSYGLFGDRLLPILAVQHLAFCALGAATAWMLYGRTGPRTAMIAGLLAGICPIMSLAASTIWTESLFVVLSTGALLAFINGGASIGLYGAAGVLAGAATLIRPNGVVLASLMLAWLFLAWLSAPPNRERTWTAVRSSAAIAIGFVAVTAFWFLHFHRVTGQWGVSDASCSMEEQSRTAVATGSEATNIFQLAAFVNLISQNDEVQRLAVTEPYRAFFEFFPARHRYYVSWFLPPELTYDDRFTGEVFREYVRVFPALYVRQIADALLFNLAHVRRQRSTIFAYAHLVEAAEAMRARIDQTPPDDPRLSVIRDRHEISWPDAEILLTRMARARPSLGGLARAHLAVSGAAMIVWGVTATLAIGGTIGCLLVGSRRVAVLAWHAMVLTGAPAILGMAADRFAMAAEPGLYVLATVAIATAAEQWRRRGSMKVVAAADAARSRRE